MRTVKLSCPACGAPITSHTTTCAYCRSNLAMEDGSEILVTKEHIEGELEAEVTISEPEPIKKKRPSPFWIGVVTYFTVAVCIAMILSTSSVASELQIQIGGGIGLVVAIVVGIYVARKNKERELGIVKKKWPIYHSPFWMGLATLFVVFVSLLMLLTLIGFPKDIRTQNVILCSPSLLAAIAVGIYLARKNK